MAAAEDASDPMEVEEYGRGFLNFFSRKRKRGDSDTRTRIHDSDNTNEIIELLKTKDEQNETDMINILEDIAKIVFGYGTNRNVMLYITTHGGYYDLLKASNVSGPLLRSHIKDLVNKLGINEHFINLNNQNQNMSITKIDLAAAEHLAYLKEKEAKKGLELMIKSDGSNCQETLESIKDEHLMKYKDSYGKQKEAERSKINKPFGRDIQGKSHLVPNKQLRWSSIYHFHKEKASIGQYEDQIEYDQVLESDRYLDDLFLVVPQENNQTKYYRLRYILQYIHQVFPNLKKLMEEKRNFFEEGYEYEYTMKMSDLLKFVDLITGIGTNKGLYVYDAACNRSNYMNFLMNKKAQYYDFFGGGSKKTYKKKTAKNINSKRKKVKVKKVKTRKKLKRKRQP